MNATVRWRTPRRFARGILTAAALASAVGVLGGLTARAGVADDSASPVTTGTDDPPPPAAVRSTVERRDFYLLSFDRYGQLANPYERDLAIAELQNRRNIERILIIAYGWANDAEGSIGAYAELVDDLLAELESPANGGETIVLGIGWDSSQTGFRKLSNDLFPLPVVADLIAWAPDRLLFPLSFWSKAAMADRIGFGGLRQTLNEIFALTFPEADAHPPIYLIGHSFGTRILSGLMKNQLGMFRAGTEPFRSARFVRGALWIQPALIPSNLPEQLSFPLVVTQNEHDHANGRLFPFGNVLVNAYTFTTFEGLIQNRLFSAIEDAAGSARDSVERAGSVLIGAGRASEDESKPEDSNSPASPRAPPADSAPESANRPGRSGSFPTRAYRATRRTGSELLSIPVALGVSLVATPVQYLYTQWQGLSTAPFDHVMHTLAQVPVLEVGVDLAGTALSREVPWGRYSKGFFALGGLHESAGRVFYPSFGGAAPPPPISYRSFRRQANERACGGPLCPGLQIVDLSDAVGSGPLGDLRDPLINYTLSWFDPIGIHSRTRDPEIRRLIEILLRTPDSEPSLPTEVPALDPPARSATSR